MKKIVVIVFVILFIVFLVYLYFENVILEVTYYDITDEKINDDLNGFTIIHISDYHNAKSKRLVNDLVQSIKNINPDIIVITGDLVDSYKTDINASIDFIKRINEFPIYYVNGNHEARLDNYDELLSKLIESNVVVLENDVAAVSYNDTFINVLGINDPLFSNKNKQKEAELIVSSEINSLNYDINNYTILLSHRPELLNAYKRDGIDLVLSGHVHGGQIRLPFVGGIYGSTQGFFPKYTDGIYSSDNTKMVVSRGLGGTIPFRINNNPELVVVTLKNK